MLFLNKPISTNTGCNQVHYEFDYIFNEIVLISLDNKFNEFITSLDKQGLVVNNIMNSPIFNIEFIDSKITVFF
jgi:hypothetical protein